MMKLLFWKYILQCYYVSAQSNILDKIVLNSETSVETVDCLQFNQERLRSYPKSVVINVTENISMNLL